ncbi:MAG: ketoacyl-ACP synthase III [Byssovorax sp.]
MLYFHGFGHFHPENQIDNAFLESLDIGTTSQWILDRVGIETRRTVLPLDYIRHTKNKDLRGAQEAALYSNAETGRRAALMAIERAGIKPSDIGMVVAGGCSPDACIPAEAARVAKLLGISGPCFDLHSACSTFGAQVHVLENMGPAVPEYALLLCPENSTRVIDFSDRSTAILFGDATSAAVVSTKVPGRARVSGSIFSVNPTGCDDVQVPRTGHFFQNGSAVQKFAIKQMSALLGDILTKVGPDRRDKVLYIGHQANLTMLEAVCRRCEIPKERHLYNIVNHGNQAAAGAPVVMSQHWDKLKKGDVVAMVVVGSGLSWSSLQIEFS